jgi:hypothetical protein
MIISYSSYQVNIENGPARSSEGDLPHRQALITLYDNSGNEIDALKLYAPDISEVYEKIFRNEEVNLDNCYVHGFSLSAFRKIFELEKNHPIVLESFSAKNAFFEAQVATDFSYTEFKGEVSFEGACFGRGKVMFNNSIFAAGANFSGTYFHTGHIEFIGARFGTGDFLFKNALFNDGLKDFSDVKFGAGEITFANTEFNSGELLFINSQFNDGRFSFKISRIAGGKVDFHYAVFGEGEVIFERADFGNSKVDFRAVDFGEGKVNFNRTFFGDGEINFEGASSRRGKIQFKRAVIGAGVKNFGIMEMAGTEMNFERTSFGPGDLSFQGSKFSTLILKSCYLNHYVDLRVNEAGYLDLSDTIVRDIIDLEPYGHDISIGTINMAGMRLIGKIFIDWENNHCKKMILDQEDTDFREKAEQFRILKVNFNQTGKYDDEDKAYIMFKRFEARSIVQKYVKRGGVYKYLAYISNGFRWLVFDAAGLYATNPLRVLFSMGVGYVVFSLVYYLLIVTTTADIISGTPDIMSDLGRSFYHSAITFFTIGYGDHYPHGSIRIVSGLEGFIGVFLMSYFTVAFVRKVLR